MLVIQLQVVLELDPEVQVAATHHLVGELPQEHSMALFICLMNQEVVVATVPVVDRFILRPEDML